jgi:hypothetical protein
MFYETAHRAVSTWILKILCWILDLFLFIIYFALSGLQFYHSHLTWGGAQGYYIFPLFGKSYLRLFALLFTSGISHLISRITYLAS